MRIGLIAAPWIQVPPPKYGGSEAVIDNLARGLQDAGHDVELFTVGDSRCTVPRSWVFPEAVDNMENSAIESIHVEAAYKKLADVDVIHDHTIIGPIFGSRAAAPGVPVVTTMHGPFHQTGRMLYSRLPERVSLIAISHHQRSTAAEVPVEAVIPHGIDTEKYYEGPGGGGYLVFVGRMSADKGVARAIETAHRAGKPLIVMCKIREEGEIAYYNDVIKPMMVGKDVELLVEPEEGHRIDLVGKADGMIFPIQWPEPFGLVMAEALACGTPVIASPHGAATEIVEPGITGFLHEDVDDLVTAVGRLNEIDRNDCRRAAEKRFSMERMVADHVRLYRRLIDRASVPTLTGRRAMTQLRSHRAAL
jgi:glycosyltransferase involved in cell wall biosynthesis